MRIISRNTNNKGIESQNINNSRKRIDQQEAGRVPVGLKEAVLAETQKLQQEGHKEKLQKVDEDTLIPPAVISVKKYGTVKNPKDSQKSKEGRHGRTTSDAKHVDIEGPNMRKHHETR